MPLHHSDNEVISFSLKKKKKSAFFLTSTDAWKDAHPDAWKVVALSLHDYSGQVAKTPLALPQKMN